jgi:tartrate dehydrogenase/decarboxylase/D-malate dehydrogenase
VTPVTGSAAKFPGGSASSRRIAVLAGDGIGKEVVPEAVAFADAAGSRHGVRLDWDHRDWGCDRYLTTGQFMPPDAPRRLSECDAILLGAVGDPRVPDHRSLWGMLIPIRRGFSQRVNIRPIRRLPGIPGPLRSEKPIDYVVVRENVEGEYSEIGGRLYHGTADEIAVQESVFTRRGVEAVMRYAFDLASSRARTLVAATKSNGIIHTMPFWDQIFAELAAEYPAVATRRVMSMPWLPSSSCGLRYRRDRRSNLSGRLTDRGRPWSEPASPAGNVDPSGEHPSTRGDPRVRPRHRRARIANPIATRRSAAMMLEHLGHRMRPPP